MNMVLTSSTYNDIMITNVLCKRLAIYLWNLGKNANSCL